MKIQLLCWLKFVKNLPNKSVMDNFKSITSKFWVIILQDISKKTKISKDLVIKFMKKLEISQITFRVINNSKLTAASFDIVHIFVLFYVENFVF